MSAEETQSKFIYVAPPLLPTLTSGKSHIKWTRLADLPAPLCAPYIAVQDRKVYVTGGISHVEHAEHQVFVYEIDNDSWDQLPTPDHYYAIPHIIDGKLTLIGGHLIATDEKTNKVSTFDETKQSWVSHYPNLLSIRTLPGVVTHMKHVIVAGGAKGENTTIVLDDIEILDWVENAQWKKVSIRLPVPIYDSQVTVSNDTVFVVGNFDANLQCDKRVYKLPVAVITNSADQQQCASTSWVELGETTYWSSSVVTGLSPLIVAGGFDATDTTTKDIKMYDKSTQKWKKIDSLSFARHRAAITAINNSAIIVIGGAHDSESTSLAVVELGQVEHT